MQGRRLLLVLVCIVGTHVTFADRAQCQSSPPPSPTQPVVLAPLAQSPGPTQAVAQREAGLRVPRDLSPWSMFLSADVFVKIVMVILALASLTTWTILIGKTFELGFAKRRLSHALRRAENARSFKEARLAVGRRGGFLSNLVAIAETEIEISGSDKIGIKERCESSFAELVRLQSHAMRRGMGILATIGAVSPFVGLFGTVWGIMNSFIGISKAQTTNLAVVAPGIAEALLATAIGLVAAVPAVIIYNHFSQAGRRYHLLLTRASGATLRLLSRELAQGGKAKIEAAG